MPKNLQEKWESDIKELLSGMGFNNPISNKTIIKKFQVDISGGEDETYLIIDATTTPNPKEKYRPTKSDTKKWFKERRRAITRHLISTHPKYKNIIWIVWIKGNVAGAMVDYAKQTNTLLLNQIVYNSYKKRIQTLDELADDNHATNIQRQMLRYKFLKLLNAPMPPLILDELDNVPAIKFRYDKANDRYAYAFAMKPDTLIKYCYVLKREEVGKPGYQRLLDEGRIKNIKEFIERKGMSFPNNIIINFPLDKNDKQIKIVEKKCNVAKESGVYNCLLSLPKYYCSAQIIDGQHRLFAFDDIQEARLKKDLKLDVLAFNHLPEDESAEIFIDLNKEQKKIDPSLYWELVGDYLSNTPHGSISGIAKDLNEGRGIFHKAIDFPSEPSSGARIKLANFCKGLDDRRLLFGVNEKKLSPVEREKYRWNFFMRAKKSGCNPKKLADQQIGLYFQLINKHKSFTPQWKNFVSTNTGLNVMLRVLVEILKYYSKISRTSSLSKKQYNHVLDAMVGYVKKQSEADIRTHLKASSEGLRGEVAKNIIQYISSSIPDFAKDTLWSEDERELKTKIARGKKRIDSKKKAFKELIEHYKQEKNYEQVLKYAKKMNKDFGDKYSSRLIEDLSTKT